MKKKDKTIKERMARLHKRKKDKGLTRRDVWAKPKHWPAIKELEKTLQEKNLDDQAKCHACGVITFLPAGTCYVCSNCGESQGCG